MKFVVPPTKSGVPATIPTTSPRSTRCSSSRRFSAVWVSSSILCTLLMGARRGAFHGVGDDLLLYARHFFRIHFPAQIAPSHHHCVGHPEDLVQIINRFRLFQFGDHRNILLLPCNGFFTLQHVFRA